MKTVQIIVKCNSFNKEIEAKNYKPNKKGNVVFSVTQCPYCGDDDK